MRDLKVEVSSFSIPADWRPGPGLWMEALGEGSFGDSLLVCSCGETASSCFPRLRGLQSWGDVILLPCLAHHDFLFFFCNAFQTRVFLLPSQHSGSGSNYLTHTCTLLRSPFLSAAFPLAGYFYSLHTELSSWSIISTAHLLQRLPVASRPGPGLLLQSPPHSPDHLSPVQLDLTLAK